jgi:hydrogenase expression/formation protein HypC
MCLAVPYEVITVIDPEHASVRVGSGTQTCFTGLVDQIEPGDWVLMHAGVAIETITQERALENLRLIAQLIAPSDVEVRWHDATP